MRCYCVRMRECESVFVREGESFLFLFSTEREKRLRDFRDFSGER